MIQKPIPWKEINDSLSWIVKNIGVPLIPTIAGLFIRCFANAEFSFKYFEFSELAFSMSLLSLLVMDDAKKINEEQLGNIIHSLFMGLLVIFMVAFVMLINEQYEIQILKDSFIQFIEKQVELNIIKSELHNLNQDILRPSATVDMIKNYSFWFSIVGIVGAIICQIKFKLSD